jgi:hypothetical protein
MRKKAAREELKIVRITAKIAGPFYPKSEGCSILMTIP